MEIDNNLVENAIRPTALGNKNWLFVGADTASDRSAVLYTVLESCRRRGLDPYAYLRDVLTRLPTLTKHQVPGITPANWARSRPVPRSLAAWMSSFCTITSMLATGAPGDAYFVSALPF